MITRIVKMNFIPEEVETFKSFFETIKWKIGSYPGCQHMELLQGMDDSAILFTYSVWEDEESLERYRNSKTFAHIWRETKKGFSEKAQAWTLSKQFDSTTDIG